MPQAFAYAIQVGRIVVALAEITEELTDTA